MNLPFGKARFEASLQRELPVLRRVALRLTVNLADAEDLVGQTMYLALKARSQFDGRHLRSWLIRILTNEFIASKRKKEVEASDLREEEADTGPGTWDLTWEGIQAETILAELDALPEEFRMVVVLCDVEQMGYEEAAFALDIPVGTVRSRLSRGRQRLRNRLALRLEGASD